MWDIILGPSRSAYGTGRFIVFRILSLVPHLDACVVKVVSAMRAIFNALFGLIEFMVAHGTIAFEGFSDKLKIVLE